MKLLSLIFVILCINSAAAKTLDCEHIGVNANIVVYFPNLQILFGGCLIKSLDSKGLGNIKEADIEHWDSTVLRIKKAYPMIKPVIPGHGAFGDSKLLDHTIALVEDYKQKKK